MNYALLISIALFSAHASACDMVRYPPAIPAKNVGVGPGLQDDTKKEKKDRIDYAEIVQTFTPAQDPKRFAVGVGATGKLLVGGTRKLAFSSSYFVSNVNLPNHTKENMKKFNRSLQAARNKKPPCRYPVVQRGVLIKQDPLGLAKETEKELGQYKNIQFSTGCAIS